MSALINSQPPTPNSQQKRRRPRQRSLCGSWASDAEIGRVLTSRPVTVINALGLHARAAARFVQLAARFTSQIRVARDAKVMDGKSIMGILLLAAARGTTITISADGADEQAAVDALVELVATGFGEVSWNA